MSAVNVTVVPVTVIVDRDVVAGKKLGQAVDAVCEACEKELAGKGDGLILPNLLPRIREAIRGVFD